MQKGCAQRGKSAPFPASAHSSLTWLQSAEWYPSAQGLTPPVRPLALHSDPWVSRDSPSRPTRPIEGCSEKKKKWCSRVQPWSLHRTSHPLSPWRTQDGPQAESCLARALKGLTLCFLEHGTPHNSFQLLPDLWMGCVF